MPAPGKHSFYDRMERPWDRLDRNSMVGHTTDTDVKLWVRVKGKGNYRLVIATEPLLRSISKAPHWSGNRWFLKHDDGHDIELLALVKLSLDGSTDFTGVVNTRDKQQFPDGGGFLRSDTHYHYGLYNTDQHRWELGVECEHSFRTMPADEGGPWDVAFGFYSCHMPFDSESASKGDASMWWRLREELRYANARYVIGGGDQVYTDGTKYLSIWRYLAKILRDNPSLEDMLSWYRDIYRGYWNFPDVKAVHRMLPNYMTWDDHEIMDGWGSYEEDELASQLNRWYRNDSKSRNLRAARKMFRAAKQVYWEYQHSHNPDTGVTSEQAVSSNSRTAISLQWDYAFANCGADHFVLDMRGHRDFTAADNAVLGAAQHDRLKTWCDSLDADRDGPIFVTSTVPMVHLKEFAINFAEWAEIFGFYDDVRDHWDHKRHNKEFRKLLDTLFEAADRTGRPLVILSGDVHIGGVFTLEGDTRFRNARVYQVTSSAITYAALGPAKARMLAKAVSSGGKIGEYENDQGETEYSGYSFRKHLVFPQHNFAIIRYVTDGKQTMHINVDIIGQSEDNRVKESYRVDLLEL